MEVCKGYREYPGQKKFEIGIVDGFRTTFFFGSQTVAKKLTGSFEKGNAKAPYILRKSG